MSTDLYARNTSTATISPTATCTNGKSTLAPTQSCLSYSGLTSLRPNTILAAWRLGRYEMESGTSMPCPHVTGVAAQIKKKHASWTPAFFSRTSPLTRFSLRVSFKHLQWIPYLQCEKRRGIVTAQATLKQAPKHT